MIDWTKERAVVTGGAGFIGSHLVDALWARGCPDILVLDNLSRGTLGNLPERKEVSFRLMDLKAQKPTTRTARLPMPKGHYRLTLAEEPPMVKQLAEAFEGAIVFHLAARVTNIRENRGDHLGMLQDNLRINANVIEAARLGKPKLMELTSTVCVYPHDAPIPTAEQHAFPYHPEDTNEGYGLAKAILEKQGEYLHRELGVPVLVPRFANAFGPRDYYDESSHVAPALIRKAFEQDEIVIWGSGNQTRTLIDARDIAETLVRLAEEPRAHDARPVNIGWAEPVSIRDLAQTILKLSGMEHKPLVFDTSQPDGHAVREFCNARLVDLIGYPPYRPLENTLVDMIQEFKEGRARL